MFFRDDPEFSELKFGHKTVGDWLKEILVEIPAPFRLAITGGLGTGKSTVLRNSLDRLEKNKKSKVRTAYVDVWKLDKDSVRRSAIIKIAKELRPDDYKTIQELKENAYGTKTENSKPKFFHVHWNIPGILFSLFIGSLTYLAILKIFEILPSSSSENAEPLKQIVSIIFGLIGFVGRMLDKSIVNIQRTISKSPMVGAEEFEECLSAILNSRELHDSRVIIVFDNIDRAPPDASKAIMSGISAFFDHSHHDRPNNVIIVVPFDDSSSVLVDSSGRSLKEDSEKMFDAIIALPKLMDEDISVFAEEKFNLALVDFQYSKATISNISNICTLSGYASPREIKHLANELRGLLLLAKKMENTVDETINSKENLLPKGSVTGYPEILLKLIICNRLMPHFSKDLISKNIDLPQSFRVDKNPMFSDEVLNQENVAKLRDFLRATVDLPKNIPISVAPFYFLKGPDQILSITSGVNLMSNLYTGDGEKLSEYISSSEDKAGAIGDLAKVYAQYRIKYKNNIQGLKNSVRAMLSLSKLDKTLINLDLANELCGAISSVPDVLEELSLISVDAFISEWKKEDQIKRVAAILKDKFSDLLASQTEKDGQQSGKLNDWLSEYIYLSKTNSEFYGELSANPDFISFDLITHKNVVKAFGKDYPGSLCSSNNTIEAVKRYITSNADEETVDTYEKITERKFSKINTFPNIETRLNEVAQEWQNAANTWLTATEDKYTAGRLSIVSFHWPFSLNQAKASAQSNINWVRQQNSRFIQKAGAGFQADVIDICFSFGFNQSISDPHLNSIIQNAFNSIHTPQFIEATERYQATSFLSESRKTADGPFLSAIDRCGAFNHLIPNLKVEERKYFIDVISRINNRKALLDAFYDLDDGIPEQLYSQYTYLTSDARISYIKLAIKAKVEYSVIAGAVDHFVSNPDDSAATIMDLIKSNFAVNTLEISNKAYSILESVPNNWKSREYFLFECFLINHKKMTTERVQKLINMALERGVNNSPEQDTKEKFYKNVINLIESYNEYYEERFIEVLLSHKDLRVKFKEDFERLKKKYKIKESFFDWFKS